MSTKKAQKLRDFNPDEVSLVKEGANLKIAFIIKNKNGEEEIMDDLIEMLKKFKFSDETATEKNLDAICIAKNLNDDQRASLKTALAVMESMSEGVVKDLYFSLSEDYASISIYKSKEEMESANSEEIKTLKASVKTLTDEKAVIEKSVEGKIEKSELEKIEKESNEKIEKLSALITDKDSVDKIVKGAAPVVIVPESVQKQLDEQSAKIEKMEKDKTEADEKIVKEADEKIVKEFIVKAENNFSFVGSSEELGTLLKKCNDVLEKEDFTTLETILKSTNEKIEQGELFEEYGSTEKDDISKSSDEGRVDVVADKIRKENPGISIQKARIKAREKIAKESK